MISPGSYREKVAEPSHKPKSDSKPSGLFLLCSSFFLYLVIKVKFTLTSKYPL